MIITGTLNGTTVQIGETDDSILGAEFADARMIIAALNSGCLTAHVVPGSRPARAAQVTTEDQRAAIAAIIPRMG
jgi:hypothetical protein